MTGTLPAVLSVGREETNSVLCVPFVLQHACGVGGMALAGLGGEDTEEFIFCKDTIFVSEEYQFLRLVYSPALQKILEDLALTPPAPMPHPFASYHNLSLAFLLANTLFTPCFTECQTRPRGIGISM